MHDTKRTECPECHVKGTMVKKITMQSLLLSKDLLRVTEGDYRFCPTATCPVVYYPEDGGETFFKDALRVRVGIKETDAPRPVCYCFNYNIESIELLITTSGRSPASDDIASRLRDGCWCETRNPQGRCCLGLVKKVEKDILAQKNPAITPELESRDDCCSI